MADCGPHMLPFILVSEQTTQGFWEWGGGVFSEGQDNPERNALLCVLFFVYVEEEQSLQGAAWLHTL